MSEVEDEEEVVKSTAAVLAPGDHAEIRRLVGEGELKAIACSRKFGVTPSAISHILAKEPKITFECLKRAREEEERIKVSAASATKAATFAEQRLQRIEDTKSTLYQTNVALAAAFQKMIREHLNGTIRLSVKELRTIQAGIGENRHERYAILNAEAQIDANELPEIVIRDLTDDEIIMMQTSDEVELGEEETPLELETI